MQFPTLYCIYLLLSKTAKVAKQEKITIIYTVLKYSGECKGVTYILQTCSFWEFVQWIPQRMSGTKLYTTFCPAVSIRTEKRLVLNMPAGQNQTLKLTGILFYELLVISKI